MATRRAGSQVRAGRRSRLRPQDRGFDEVLIHAAGVIGTTPDYWGNDYFDDTYYYATFCAAAFPGRRERRLCLLAGWGPAPIIYFSKTAFCRERENGPFRRPNLRFWAVRGDSTPKC